MLHDGSVRCSNDAMPLGLCCNLMAFSTSGLKIDALPVAYLLRSTCTGTITNSSSNTSA